jgi:hypothetical protein
MLVAHQRFLLSSFGFPSRGARNSRIRNSVRRSRVAVDTAHDASQKVTLKSRRTGHRNFHVTPTSSLAGLSGPSPEQGETPVAESPLELCPFAYARVTDADGPDGQASNIVIQIVGGDIRTAQIFAPRRHFSHCSRWPVPYSVANPPSSARISELR